MAGETRDRVKRHIEEATKLGIRSTPSFLIGTMMPGGQLNVVRHESGAMPLAAFSRILDELIRSEGSR
jgi:protein-disulfide isomerase